MKILDYIFAARPMLLLPVWSIYIISMHNHHHLSGKSFQYSDLLILFILTVIAGGAYYINQIYDYESDLINNKVGFLQRGILSQKEILVGYMLTIILSLMLSFYFTLISVLIISFLIVLGYLYSAKPFRLKDRIFWGGFANSFGYGFLVPLLVMPEINMHNGGLLGWDGPFYFAFAVGGVYLLTTIPDKDGDKKMGKRTEGVVFPEIVVKVVALLFTAVTIWLAYESDFKILFVISIVSSLVILLTLFIKKESYLLFAIKLPILLLTILASYYQPFYLLFIVALIISTRIYYKKRFNLNYPKLL